MKKLFDVMAVIALIVALISGCALDSPSNVPLKICALCVVYLAIYTRINIKIGNFIDLDGGEKSDVFYR